MGRWAAAGVTPMKILSAATIDNARFFKLDSEIGLVAEGKKADLLILDEDPRHSIEAFDSIEWVISNGVLIKRDELSAINSYKN